MVTTKTKGRRLVHRADQLEYVTVFLLFSLDCIRILSVPTAVLLYKCFIVIQYRLSILAMNLLYHMSRGSVCAAERMKQLASERYVSELLILSG